MTASPTTAVTGRAPIAVLRLGRGGVAEDHRGDEGIVELMAVVDLFSGYNKPIDGLQVSPTRPWYG